MAIGLILIGIAIVILLLGILTPFGVGNALLISIILIVIGTVVFLRRKR